MCIYSGVFVFDLGGRLNFVLGICIIKQTYIYVCTVVTGGRPTVLHDISLWAYTFTVQHSSLFCGEGEQNFNYFLLILSHVRAETAVPCFRQQSSVPAPAPAGLKPPTA